MMTIIITLPHFFEGEAEKIASFLVEGTADLVHIRKPGATEEDVERLILQILAAVPDESSSVNSRLVIHDHYQLAVKYTLHGIHLNGRSTSVPVLEAQPNYALSITHYALSISRSCHSLEELKAWKDRCNYLSLSPIFDSISKKGYMSAFSEEEIRRAHQEGIIDQKVVALGGVTFDKLDKVKEMGFGGAMILGDAWKNCKL